MTQKQTAKSHSKRAVQAAFWAAINSLIPMLVGLAVLVVTSRMLRPSDFGVVALATGLALVGTALCPAGFGEAIVQRLEVTPQHLDTVFWLCLSSGCAVFLIECALAKTFADWFKVHIIATLVPVLASRIIGDMAAVVPNALITRSMSFHLFALRSLVVSLVAALLTIVLLLEGFSIWALVISQIAASFITMTAGFLTCKWVPGFRVSLAALKEVAGYGAFSSASQNIGQIYLQNEQILVGYYLGTAQLGFYNFSKRIIIVLNNIVAGSVGTVAHPMFSEIQEDLERVRRGFLSATFISSFISFPMFIGLAFISARLIPLVFGERWVDSVILIQIQCMSALLTCFGGIQGGLVTSRGKANWWFYYQLFATCLIILIVILFARFGLVTMLTLLTIRQYILLVIPIRMCLKLLSLRAKDYAANFMGPILGIIIMSLALFTEQHVFTNMGNLVGLAVDIICGAITYSVTLLLVEQKRVLSLLSMVLPKFFPRRLFAG